MGDQQQTQEYADQLASLLAPEGMLLLVCYTDEHELARGDAQATGTAGNTMYFALSGTSLGAVLLASYELFSVIRWVGAAYLIWLGITAFIGKSSVLSVSPSTNTPRRPGRTG